MKCPHLMKRIIFFCKADKKVYSPSHFQIDEYCRKKEHIKCPFFLRIPDENLEGRYCSHAS